MKNIIKVLRFLREEEFLDEYKIKALGIEKRELETILGFLLMRGLIKEIELSEEMCSQCPLSKVCGIARRLRTKDKIKAIIITRKGIEFLKSLGKSIVE